MKSKRSVEPKVFSKARSDDARESEGKSGRDLPPEAVAVAVGQDVKSPEPKVKLLTSEEVKDLEISQLQQKIVEKERLLIDMQVRVISLEAQLAQHSLQRQVNELQSSKKTLEDRSAGIVEKRRFVMEAIANRLGLDATKRFGFNPETLEVVE